MSNLKLACRTSRSQNHILNPKPLAKYLDFANHHPDATPEQIKKLCQSVVKFGFHSAFVNPCYISLAKEYLEDKFPVGTVISFPLGQDTRDGKVLLAIETTRKGADELDVMMNVGLFKAGKYKEVLEEMKAVNAAAKEIRRNVVVKFIIETGFLTNEEIKKSSELVLKSGADFVKTCSGWGPRGARLEDIKLIREAIGEKIKIKVAGGIDTYQEAIDFINAGANRIGTSKAIEIITRENS
jgi:deoxyribose-phosphate aldolase